MHFRLKNPGFAIEGVKWLVLFAISYLYELTVYWMVAIKYKEEWNWTWTDF